MDIYRVFSSGAFDFPTIKAIATAYEHVRMALDLDPTDPLREVIGKKIIEHAENGEQDWTRLRDAALKELRGHIGETLGARSRHLRWLAWLTLPPWRRR